jgi:hypothetical protein
MSRVNQTSASPYIPEDVSGLAWQVKLVKGLDCPFCVGYWIGLLLLVATLLCPKPLRPIWLTLLGSLGLNYVVGHISAKID